MHPEPLVNALASASVRRPGRTLLLVLVAVAASIAWAATHLDLKSSNLDLIDPELPPVQQFFAFAREFGTPNVLVVVVEGGDEAAVTRAIDRAGPRIRQVDGVRQVLDRIPLDDALLADFAMDPYLLSHDRRMGFLFVQPDDLWSRADTIEPFVEGVRAALAEARLDELGARADLTGIPAYALDDKHVIQRDISMLSGGSFLLVLGLFAVAFRNLRRPLLAMATLLSAVILTLGVVAVVPGHLTLLSASFASVLFGLGIDYGIHIIHRVEDLMAGGLSEREAVPRALTDLSRGLTTGALTTAGIFFTMLACGFRGFAELGFIAGIGVLLCLGLMMTVLPALLVRFHPAHPGRIAVPPPRWGLILLRLQHPALAGTLALAAIASPAVFGLPTFDSDYLNLEPKHSETVRLEREMVARSDYSPQFAVFVADAKEEALRIADALYGLEPVGLVRSIADIDLLEDGLDDPGRIPESLRSQFVSPAGHYAVYAYPAGDVWNPRQQAKFLDALRGIDPDVTGMPVLGEFMIGRSLRALRITGLLGGAAMLILVFLDFRRPLPTLLAALPTILTMVALGALMRLCGLHFNPLNVMALPIVIGIAVDDGVHMVHRFLLEQGSLPNTLEGTGRSIFLTSATTIAAFGCLAFTSHQGLASLCITVCLGVGCALLMSVLVLPTTLTSCRLALLDPNPHSGNRGFFCCDKPSFFR
jgi:predicted RND superfamily exporter protein